MNNKTKRFISRVSIIAIIMLIIAGLPLFIRPNLYLSVNFITVLFFYILTIGVYFLATSSFNSNFKMAFVNIFMAGTVVKLFALLLYIIVYLFAFGQQKLVFLVFLLINYVPFTFFEVFFIVKNASSFNKQ